MSWVKDIKAAMPGLFGEVCEHCGSPVARYPLLEVEPGAEMKWTNALLTLGTSRAEMEPEECVSALTARIRRYAEEPTPVHRGLQTVLRWCGSCLKGTMIMRLRKEETTVEEREYSFFSEWHRRLAVNVVAIYSEGEAREL